MSEAAPADTPRAPPGAFRLEAAAAGRLAAHGTLTFATARLARLEGLAVLGAAEARSLEIDCSGISASDSAGLAVLLDWLAAARAAGRTLRYTGLPQGLAALARISELRQVLETGV